MHGILALGAAHLHASTNLDLKATVDRHRYLAMQGLNSRSPPQCGGLSRGRDDRGTHLTALLATAYLLTFAASYMGDPLSLFLVLVRACSSLTGQIVKEGFTSTLLPEDSRSATSEPHLEVMKRRIRNADALPLEDINEGIASLDLVEKQCSFAPFQRDMLDLMKSVFEHIQDPYKGIKNPHYKNRPRFCKAIYADWPDSILSLYRYLEHIWIDVVGRLRNVHRRDQQYQRGTSSPFRRSRSSSQTVASHRSQNRQP